MGVFTRNQRKKQAGGSRRLESTGRTPRLHRRAGDRRLMRGGQDRVQSDDRLPHPPRDINNGFDSMDEGDSIRSIASY